jgi:DUF971 family protein
MSDPPRSIRAVRDRGEFEIAWSDDAVHQLPFRFVRGRCPCAACVDEMTGRRVVDVEAIPPDIQATDASFSGNYALKIAWSDGHDTGLYRWDYLRQLGESLQTSNKSDEERA